MTNKLYVFVVSIFVFQIFQDIVFARIDSKALIKEFPVPPRSHHMT